MHQTFIFDHKTIYRKYASHVILLDDIVLINREHASPIVYLKPNKTSSWPKLSSRHVQWSTTDGAAEHSHRLLTQLCIENMRLRRRKA